MGEVAKIEPRAVPQVSGEGQHFELMQRKAALFAASPLIPESLRSGGSQQALANCYIGLQMAEAMQENALTVLQNIHVVKGKAGFSAQFMIARANASGVFKDGIDWRIEGAGDTLAVTAFATLAATGREVSFCVSIAMAKAEAWTSNPKYKSMPELMLRYRSGTFLVRLYAPQVMFGYQTAEEIDDTRYAAITGNATVDGEAKPSGRALLAASLADDLPKPTEGEEALAIVPAPSPAESVAAGEQDKAVAWANSYRTKVDGCFDRADLADLQHKEARALENLKGSRPDLHARCLAFVQAKLASFDAAADDDDDDTFPGDLPLGAEQ